MQILGLSSNKRSGLIRLSSVLHQFSLYTRNNRFHIIINLLLIAGLKLYQVPFKKTILKTSTYEHSLQFMYHMYAGKIFMY